MLRGKLGAAGSLACAGFWQAGWCGVLSRTEVTQRICSARSHEQQCQALTRGVIGFYLFCFVRPIRPLSFLINSGHELMPVEYVFCHVNDRSV